jgi:precorrin-2 dehydrogenase/sirohydrochlorin ferrochelatase
VFPILVDLKEVRVALAGKGEAALKRLAVLRADGAAPAVFAPDASRALIDATGEALIQRLPTEAELADIQVLFIAGLATAEAQSLAAKAQHAKALVNVEDDKALCDFHVPAIVRRGDLVISISTNGTSPALAHLLRRRLETEFDEDWAERMKAVARWRQTWRAEGIAPAEITARTQSALAERGWLR